ncbi:MAG: alpha-E domain-containing protein [Actinomycetota bacterium]
MLSRVADSIYWMSRYVERAENIARFIDANMNLTLDQFSEEHDEQWLPLVLTTADLPLFQHHYNLPSRENVIEFLTFDPANPNSIVSCLKSARENARLVRDTISSEMWEQVNTFYLFVASATYSDIQQGDSHAFFNRIKTQSHLLGGVTATTLSRGEGWHFGRLGRHLERADKTCRLLDVKYFVILPNVAEVGTPYDALQWRALLKSASAFEMFRRRHGQITPERVAEFLILDRDFPRAICHCLAAAQESLHAVSGTQIGTFTNSAEQQLGLLCSRLNFARIDEIIGFGLHEFLDDIQIQLNKVGQAIFDEFFAVRGIEELDARRQSWLNSAPGQRQSIWSMASGGAE